MKVLYITHATDLSGANQSMLQMIRELKDNHGIQPFVICPHIYESKDRNIQTECNKIGIPCISHRMTNFKRRKTSFFQKLYFVVFQSIYVLHLLWILRNKSFDIIHSNSSVTDTGAYLAYFKKTHHVWHLREFGKEDFGLTSCLGPKYEKFIYKKADVFIAISDAVKRVFSQVIDVRKLVRIYNGINPPESNNVSQHNNRVVKFCVVGRVDENKNQMEAIKACSLLIKEGITNFELIIIGRTEEKYEMYISDYIRKESLENNVKLLGQRYDVSQLLTSMDVGLMLSKAEAFGRVTIEYQLHNLAVIASDSGANSELIEDNKTGLLYRLGDVEALKKKMSLLISDPDKLKSIALSGYKNANSTFKSINNSNAVFDVYNRCANYNFRKS